MLHLQMTMSVYAIHIVTPKTSSDVRSGYVGPIKREDLLSQIWTNNTSFEARPMVIVQLQQIAHTLVIT